MALSAATSLLRSTFTFLEDIPRRDALILTSFAAALGSAICGSSLLYTIGPISLYLANSAKDPSDRPIQTRVAKINLAISGAAFVKFLLGGSNTIEATLTLINMVAATALHANMHFGAYPRLSV